jgi:hypothetical protein
MTVSVASTIQNTLDKGDPDRIGDLFRAMKLGTMLAPLKRVFTGLTSGTVFDLTAIDGTGETVGASNPLRLPLLALRTLRVVTGGTGVGTYILTDVGGAAVTAATSTVVGIVTISDDGKTLTFPVALTAFTIEYIPRSAVDMTAVNSALDGAP